MYAALENRPVSGSRREQRQPDSAAFSFLAQNLGDRRLTAPATGAGATGFRDCLFSCCALPHRGSNRAVGHTLTVANDHSASSFGRRLRHPENSIPRCY